MTRIDKLYTILDAENIDGFFISSVPNITYLTGFTGDSSRLLVSRSRCILITDGRYTEQAANECYLGVEVFKWIDNKRYAIDTYAHLVRECEVKKLAFEGDILTFNEFEVLKNGLVNVELVSLSGITEGIRQVKDSGEIANLRRACAITDKALADTLPFIKTGVSEIEIAARLEYNMRMKGAEGLSFETIVLSGPKTSLLHGHPGERKLEKGDWLLFDYGALYKGYHADSSRAFIIGEADAQQKELYSVVQQAQTAAVKVLKPGIAGKVADDEVRKHIPSKYLELYYPGLGHGVGLEIHEQPFLGQTCTTVLQENMVVTIEPGIYLPGQGGLRIEDTVLITAQGAEVLTQFPRELQIL